MITVPEATKKIVERSRYLTEAMSKNLINYSSLARYIKPELEKMLLKPVSDAAILMALKRLEKEFQPKFVPLKIFSGAPEMIVRSNLVEFTMNNSAELRKNYQKLLNIYAGEQKYFFTLTEGVFETTIIVSKDLQQNIEHVLNGEQNISTITHLSAITIRLPKENISTPGVYYFFLKSLAWEGINIVEIVSTQTEVSIIFAEKDVNRAFAIVQTLFEEK
ncbi:MAG TPA: hypothetical protein VGT05_01990 [Patescibacteria group bacterium]|nr:hypothetical protein [Patescibacteria group bacterium]